MAHGSLGGLVLLHTVDLVHAGLLAFPHFGIAEDLLAYEESLRGIPSWRSINPFTVWQASFNRPRSLKAGRPRGGPAFFCENVFAEHSVEKFL